MSIFTKEYLPLINAQYPGFGEGWSITMVASSLNLMSETPQGVSARANSLQFEKNLFPDDAVESSVEESTQRVESADGYVFVRAEKQGNVPVLLTLKLTEGS